MFFRIYFTGVKSYMQNLVVIYKLKLPSLQFVLVELFLHLKKDVR